MMWAGWKGWAKRGNFFEEALGHLQSPEAFGGSFLKKQLCPEHNILYIEEPYIA